MGSCSSSNSNAERRDVINVTVLKPPTHAQGTAASHVVSKEVEQQHEREKTKKKDEKEKKKEKKKDDATDSEKKDTKQDKDGKKKKHKDRKKSKDEDKKDDDTRETNKEKKKKKNREDKNGGSKEESSSSDSSSSAEDEADPKKAGDGNAGAVASKSNTRLSDGGGVDTTVTLSGDAGDGEKSNAVVDIDGAGIAEVSPVLPPMTGQIVVQADTEASVSVEAHIDLSDQSQTTQSDANVTIKMTDDMGGDGGGGAMSVDIVLSSGGDGEVAIYGDSSGASNRE